MKLDDSLAWLALGLTQGLGPRLTGKLLEKIGPPENAFMSQEGDLVSLGIPSAVAQAMTRREAFPRAEK